MANSDAQTCTDTRKSDRWRPTEVSLTPREYLQYGARIPLYDYYFNVRGAEITIEEIVQIIELLHTNIADNALRDKVVDDIIKIIDDERTDAETKENLCTVLQKFLLKENETRVEEA
jgi:hypothetical protein